jgi:cytosine permease
MRQPQDTTLYRGTAFVAWAIGALAAVIVHVLAPEICEALVGMIVGGVAYLAVEKRSVPQRKVA